MAANQASMARRQRERQRMQRRREKQAQRLERREAKKGRTLEIDLNDPMNDPTIDWGDAVREVEVDDAEVGIVEEEEAEATV